MLSLAKAVLLSTLVVAGAVAHCPGAKLVSTSTINAGGHEVTRTTHSCGAKSVSRRQTPLSVCGASCTVACNDNAGNLPPVSQDCQTIENSITILQGTIAPTFVVQPNHLESLTFGTCTYFFENTGTVPLQACWTDLGSLGHADGVACFPPVHPPFSEGLCTSSDNSWAVGAAHT